MDLLREKKEHIINNMPNLTPEEKRNLITHFNTHPEDEGKIDWNKASTLRYRDFVPIIDAVSKTAKKKAVKVNGIKGLTEGKDYVTVFEYSYVGGGGRYNGTVMGYSPLSWESSRQIASSYVGSDGVEGKWCVAYQKTSNYWNQYCGDEESIFIYFVDYRQGDESPWGKVAVRVYANSDRKYEVWNAADHRVFSSGGEPPDTDDYPEFLFFEDKMEPIIRKARKLINEAGGLKAEKTKFYEIMVNVYGEVNKNGVLEGSVWFEQMSFTEDGGYDTEDDGDDTTYSRFSITKVGQGANPENAEFVYDFNDFNCQNGVGIYIEYKDDVTPDDAYRAASNRWEGEINGDPDMYDLTREFKELMNGDKLDYIIINNYNEIDDYLKSIIEDNYFVFYDRSDRNYGYRGAQDAFDTMEERDLEGNEYTILYSNNYNYTKKANDDWVSLPSQRKRDRQMDLPFGL